MQNSSFNNFNFESAIKWHLDQVRKLRAPTGLFTASASDVTTGYNKAWLRDIYFMTLGFKYTGEMEVVKETKVRQAKIYYVRQRQVNTPRSRKSPIIKKVKAVETETVVA